MEGDLHVLFARYLDGECSEAELQRLYDYFGHPEDDSELAELIRTYMAQYDVAHPDSSVLADEIADSAYPRVMKATKPVRRLRWLPYAAAVAVLLSVGWLLLVDSRQSSVLPTGQAGDSLAATEILPGGNRAVLTLADGRTIDLSEAQTGIIIQDGITYLDGSQVMENEELRMENDRPTFNSITTPKGGTYHVTLPDGSKVWLNAASTLKYPSRFAGDSREVILEGEAFFDVASIYARNAIAREQIDAEGSRAIALRAPSVEKRVPFLVKTSGQTVEVLGTQFNISAYQDDPETKTTLVEGKVKVMAGTQKDLTTHDSRLTTKILQPGQQATTRGAVTQIREVDPAQYTAWKSGKFSFDGKPFAQVMDEVSRWYDLEIVYEGARPVGQLVGDAYRNQNLSIVLGMLDVLEINYKLDVSARKLTIYDTKGGDL